MIIIDYLFGRGVSKALPYDGIRIVYSKRSGRIKQIYHNDRLFATIKPNGSMALTIYGASILIKSKAFLQNCVIVKDEAVEFVKRGRSVFCKFVEWAGKNVLPRNEVAVLDKNHNVIAVGKAVINGRFMQEFNSGIAVKVREGLLS